MWMFLPLSGGIGIGLAKGESLDMILFSLGAHWPWRPWARSHHRAESKRSTGGRAAGEQVEPREFEPSQRVTWATVTAIIAWICVSYALFGG